MVILLASYGQGRYLMTARNVAGLHARNRTRM